MSLVRHVLRHPATNEPLKNKSVTVQLASAGFVPGEHAEIVQSSFARTSSGDAGALAAGTFQIDLTPNDDLTPTGTSYKVTVPGNSTPWTIIVPTGTAPNVDGSDHYWWLEDLLVDSPPSPASIVAGVVEVVEGSGITVDATDPQRPIVSSDATGAVSSVFTRTGAVVAASGDYAAFYDALGAAAAAQAAAVATADSYTDGKITAEVTRANAAYDALGAAAAAQAAAIAASQPLDSDLTAIAALATTSFGRALLTQADAAATRTTLGLGTAATQATTAFDASGAAAAAQAASQPLDSDLTAIAALATTTFGRSFLALADAAAARTLLGLGTLATQSGTFSGTSSGTNTGDQTITLTGDVTGSGTGSFTATMKNTGTAGTYGDATHTVTLTTDAQGRVTAVTTNVITGSSFTRLLKTANYTAAIGDYVAADTTGGAFTVTLPAASGGKGTIVLKWVAGAAAPSIAVTGSDHFDTTTGSTGGAFTLLNQTATYDSDGTSIWSVRNSFALSTLDSRYVLDSTATTKGDILAATGAGAITRVAVGSNTQVLTADSTQATGVKWAAAPSGGAVPTFSSPAYLSMPRVNQGPGAAMGVAGNLRAYPLDIPIAVTVTAIGIEITTAVAGSTARLGIYSDVAGVPSALLLDAGTVSGAATGTLEASVASLVLPAGRYWLTMVGQGTTGPTVRAPGGTAVVTKINQAAANATAFPNSCVFSTAAGTTGALPGTFGAASISNGDNVGMVYLKVA